jgi:hypothetical protein
MIFVKYVIALRRRFLRLIFLILSWPEALLLGRCLIMRRIWVGVLRDLLEAAWDKQQPLALSVDRICQIVPPQVVIETGPRIFLQLLWLCPAVCTWVPFCCEWWGVALSVMLGEPFYYFPDTFVLFQATLSTTNCTWFILGLNPDLCNEKLAIIACVMTSHTSILARRGDINYAKDNKYRMESFVLDYGRFRLGSTTSAGLKYLKLECVMSFGTTGFGPPVSVNIVLICYWTVLNIIELFMESSNLYANYPNTKARIHNEALIFSF